VFPQRAEAGTSASGTGSNPLWAYGNLHIYKASQGCGRTSLLGHQLFPQTTSIAIQPGQSLWRDS